MRQQVPKFSVLRHGDRIGLRQPSAGRTTGLRPGFFSAVTLLIGSERPGELTQSFLVPFIRDLGEVTGELEAHPFPGADSTLASVFKHVEKVANRNAEHLGHFKQATGGDTVDAALVFVRLLIGNAYQIGKLLLRQT
jgi:hypothetical protein